MSLILDALNRADRDRQEEKNVPSIQAMHQQPDSKAKFWGWGSGNAILLGLLFIAIAVIAVLSFGGKNGEDDALSRVEVQTDFDSVKEKAISSQNQVTKANATRVDATGVNVTEANVAGVDDSRVVATLGGTGLSAVRSKKELPKPVSIPEDTKKVSSLYAQGEKKQSSLREEKERLDERLELLKADTSNTLRKRDVKSDLYSQIPQALELSRNKQQAIPRLEYATHVYSQETGSGFIIINNKKYRRGDQVMPGLVLLEIQQDFSVFDLNGTLFKLPALNSWINF